MSVSQRWRRCVSRALFCENLEEYPVLPSSFSSSLKTPRMLTSMRLLMIRTPRRWMWLEEGLSHLGLRILFFVILNEGRNCPNKNLKELQNVFLPSPEPWIITSETHSRWSPRASFGGVPKGRMERRWIRVHRRTSLIQCSIPEDETRGVAIFLRAIVSTVTQFCTYKGSLGKGKRFGLLIMLEVSEFTILRKPRLRFLNGCACTDLLTSLWIPFIKVALSNIEDDISKIFPESCCLIDWWRFDAFQCCEDTIGRPLLQFAGRLTLQPLPG